MAISAATKFLVMEIASQKSKPTPLRQETWLTPSPSNVVRTSLRTNARSLTNHLNLDVGKRERPPCRRRAGRVEDHRARRHGGELHLFDGQAILAGGAEYPCSTNG